MNYEIKDPYHVLYVKLNSNVNTSENNLYLQTYVNNSSTPHSPTYVPINNTNPYTFKIKHSDYQIGDVITNIRVLFTSTNPIPLYDLHEGVSILVDGAESYVKKAENDEVILDGQGNPIMENVVKNSQFAINFDNEGEHTVQAIYKGNSSLGIALSDKITLVAEQKVDPNPSPQPGNYKLEITKMPNSMKYMSEVFWQFKLTKGGQVVGGKTVEKITPRNIWSDTDGNADGLYEVKTPSVSILKQWNVGTYTVGARFYHQTDPDSDKSVICSVWKKDFKITKNTPRLSGTQPASGKKGYAKFYLRYPALKGVADTDLGIANAKVTIKVGGKKYTKTTDSKGMVKLYRNSTKKATYKVSWAGNKNLNKVSKTFS